MNVDHEQHKVALIERDAPTILSTLRKSFGVGNGSRQKQLDYLDERAVDLGYNIVDFDPALLMKNETIKEGLVGLLSGRHGASSAFNHIEDPVEFIRNDLEVTFSRDEARW
jgi:hypothetical protein